MEINEDVFKKVPDVSEINKILALMVTHWNSKCNLEYLDRTYEKISNTKPNSNEISCLNESVREVLKELRTSITSNVLCGANRYLKRPYSKSVCDSVLHLHDMLEKIQNDCFQSDEKAPVGILLLGIFKQCMRCQRNIKFSLSRPYVSWYYGNYNTIVDSISKNETLPVYWMDDSSL